MIYFAIVFFADFRTRYGRAKEQDFEFVSWQAAMQNSYCTVKSIVGDSNTVALGKDIPEGETRAKLYSFIKRY